MTSKDLAPKTKTSLHLADIILSHLDDFISVIDRQHHFVFINNTHHFPQPYGILEKHCYEVFAGKSHPCDLCPLKSLSGQQSRISHIISRGEKQYQLTISPLSWEDGTPFYLAVMRNITGIKPEDERLKVERPLLRPQLQQLEYHHTPLAGLDDLIGVSKSWLTIKTLIRELAQFPTVSVLITGETGTGKELVAQALHKATCGEGAPFVPLNCTAIPESLLESELFGYERGAFTGANRTKKGLFELAHGGTLFLDEIGELSPTIQPKLLRVLETKSFGRLGGAKRIMADFRLLCATNKPLRLMVEEGKFREDLFHRLGAFTITIPSLRDRREDIPPLVEAFIRQANLHLGKKVQEISPEALTLLQPYPWPGNVRELKNLIERAVILTKTGGRIEKTAFPPAVFSLLPEEAPALPLREVERQHLEAILARCRGNKSQAAKFLRISRTTLRKKLRDYNLL